MRFPAPFSLLYIYLYNIFNFVIQITFKNTIFSSFHWVQREEKNFVLTTFFEANKIVWSSIWGACRQKKKKIMLVLLVIKSFSACFVPIPQCCQHSIFYSLFCHDETLKCLFILNSMHTSRNDQPLAIIGSKSSFIIILSIRSAANVHSICVSSRPVLNQKKNRKNENKKWQLFQICNIICLFVSENLERCHNGRRDQFAVG